MILIEDSIELSTILKEALPHYHIDTASSAEEALSLLTKDSYDLALVDIGLPGKNGFWLLEELRKNPDNENLPVMFLTGSIGTGTKISAFKLGADDFIEKPFDLNELDVRIKLRLQKSQKSGLHQVVKRVGGLEIHSKRKEVYSLNNGERTTLTLTPTEFKILEYLSKSPGVFRERNEILSAVWGEKISVMNRVIDVHISALRRKIKAAGVQVESRIGGGYRLMTNSELITQPTTVDVLGVS